MFLNKYFWFMSLEDMSIFILISDILCDIMVFPYFSKFGQGPRSDQN